MWHKIDQYYLYDLVMVNLIDFSTRTNFNWEGANEIPMANDCCWKCDCESEGLGFGPRYFSHPRERERVNETISGEGSGKVYAIVRSLSDLRLVNAFGVEDKSRCFGCELKTSHPINQL